MSMERLYQLIALVLVLAVHGVGAVNVIGYNNVNACENAGLGCYNIAPQVCCAFGGLIPRSMSIGSKPPTGFAAAFTGNTQTSCLTSICTGGGEGTLCCIQSFYWGGAWYYLSEEADINIIINNHSAAGCERSMEPNALFYTSSGSTWVKELAHHELHGPILELLEKQDNATKLDWFRRHGKLIEQHMHGSLDDSPVACIV